MTDNAPEQQESSENALLGDYESPQQGAAEATVEGQAQEQTQEQVATTDQSDWLSGFDQETQDYIGNKAWKSPSDMLQSYQNLERLKGAPDGELFQIKDGMSEDDRAAVYSALGRPESPDNYSMEVGEDHIKEVADWFKGKSHELGLSDHQAKAIYDGFNETITEYASGISDQAKQAHLDSIAQLQKEWGGGFDAQANLAERGAQQLGLSNDDLVKIRDAGVAAPMMRALAKFGNMMGEGEMKGLNPNESKAMIGAYTPQQAQAEVQSLKTDTEFMSRYMKGDPAAQKKMENLYKCIAKS